MMRAVGKHWRPERRANTQPKPLLTVTEHLLTVTEHLLTVTVLRRRREHV